MNNIISYKNKNVGVLGLGISGLAAAKILLNSNANVFAFDDLKDPPPTLPKITWTNYQKWPWLELFAVVVSPGIPINKEIKHKAIQLALDHNVKIINDIDLFIETNPKAKIVGITGTNGKSTTVALLHHILKFNKIKCVIGGNFGLPACEIIDPGNNGVIILELSSYQLDGTNKLSLSLASIINITPDHLDYHDNFETYVSCKLKILKFINNNGTLVLNKNNKFLDKLINEKKHQRIKVIKTHTANYREFINDNSSLDGNHNQINASIAISLAKNLKVSEKKIKLSIKSFKSLPHRMEILYASKRIKIINDSKSTNGEATAAALSSFHNVFWIVGGQPKIDGIGEAKGYLDRVVECFIIGESYDFFATQISKYQERIKLNKSITLKNATELAIKNAQKSNLKKLVILLSPSAASFDQFKDFEERGDKFKKIIDNQIKEGVLTC
ncbi:UDP-N-acetylmuramoyl-L-alanine--D-glutamate ligase [Alphaproteobacteria bacterium]|nr:UDP-N-acetylmuramoyl-L-alanine--D-glutamate ligase [Alphaproteobacteria bacterium]